MISVWLNKHFERIVDNVPYKDFDLDHLGNELWSPKIQYELYKFLNKFDIPIERKRIFVDELNEKDHNIIWLSVPLLASVPYVLKNISSDVLEFIKQNNIEVVIHGAKESFDWFFIPYVPEPGLTPAWSFSRELDKVFSEVDIPKSLVKILVNNVDLPPMRNGECIRVLPNFWPIYMSMKHRGDFIVYKNLKSKRKYNFCYLAGQLVAREFRIKFIVRAKEEGLLNDKFLLTKIGPQDSGELKKVLAAFKHIDDPEDAKWFSNKNEEFISEVLKTYLIDSENREIDLDGLYRGMEEWYLPEAALNSHVHIAIETRINVNSVTEKTYKPIIAKLPFLVLGPQNMTKTLTDLGFKLYDEVFDYSFDRYAYVDDRIKVLVEELKRLSTTNLSEIHDILKPKLEYNRKVFLEMSEDKSEWLYALTGDREYVS